LKGDFNEEERIHTKVLEEKREDSLQLAEFKFNLFEISAIV